jgi:tyrosyl-tRNA synthetase
LVGFDPTADSLHVGHLLGQLTLRRFQLGGHRPFPLAGGATGMIGDPGGRSDERNLLDPETLRANVAKIEVQLQRLLDFDAGPTQARLVNNSEWTAELALLDFLRDVGKHITVNQMLARDSVRSRIESESGISYTEFSYMLLQANDFRHLYENHGVELQCGGSDQWGNIVQGVDLVRRTLAATVHGLTWPLLTLSSGQKMGKSVGGAVWLDPSKTSPYQFRQFWIGVDDAHVERFLLQLTFLGIDEVAAVMAAHQADPGRREAQRVLALEVTTLVHGPAAHAQAAAAADVLFYGGDPTAVSAETLDAIAAEVPVTRADLAGLDLVGLLTATGLAASNADARRGLQQRAFAANGDKLQADANLADLPLLHGRYLLLAKGKKTFHLVDAQLA